MAPLLRRQHPQLVRHAKPGQLTCELERPARFDVAVTARPGREEEPRSRTSQLGRVSSDEKDRGVRTKVRDRCMRERPVEERLEIPAPGFERAEQPGVP